MSGRLGGLRAAFLVADGVEEAELVESLRAVRAEGGEGHIIAPHPGTVGSVRGGAKGEELPVDRVVGDVRARDYHALVVPGGADSLRELGRNEKAIALVRDFVNLDKPVAALCDGPQLLADAGMLTGRRVTSARALAGELRQSGADWVDKAVQVDQRLLTSRSADDLPSACSKLVEVFEGAVANARVDESSEESFPASDAPAWGPSSIG